MKWSYGITTVPQRLSDLLPRTLCSLAAAGFDKPRLFVDGAKDAEKYRQFGLEVTTRFPTIHTAGNWILSLAELYIREPTAERFAIFQDDLITYRNLRQYLERCEYPEEGYWNLYTFPQNQKLVPKGVEGWFISNQRGLGAIATVFSLDAVVRLLTHPHLVKRPQDAKRGKRSIDGGIVTAFRKAGWKEYVHNPSLVQHTGVLSSMSNKRHPLSSSFRGEEFDAMELIVGDS